MDLASIRKDRLLFVDQVIGPQRLRTVSAVGETFPLYCTANGKAYLAMLDNRSVERLIGKSYEARTDTTITTSTKLLAELEQIRKDGVAFDREEHTPGISAAGIALMDALGNPIAISVPVPTQRFDEAKELIAERLLETKHALLDLVESR